MGKEVESQKREYISPAAVFWFCHVSFYLAIHPLWLLVWLWLEILEKNVLILLRWHFYRTYHNSPLSQSMYNHGLCGVQKHAVCGGSGGLCTPLCLPLMLCSLHCFWIINQVLDMYYINRFNKGESQNDAAKSSAFLSS